MRVRPGAFLVGLIAVLAAAPACAGPGDGGGGRHHRFAERGAMQMPAGAVMDGPMRGQEFRRDNNEMPMFGRLSPEERRQLRRDIRNAGGDIYRRPPPPPYEGPPR